MADSCFRGILSNIPEEPSVFDL